VKILFYGHVLGLGLGHYARSVRLAEAALEVGFEAVVTSGGRAGALVPRRPEVGVLELSEASLGDVSDPAWQARERTLLAYCREARPDVVVVDALPFGARGELAGVLLAAQEEGWSTRLFWGLPYSKAVEGPVRNPRLRRAMAGYTGVLAYAERDWMDPFPDYAAFGLPGVAEHVGMVTAAVAPAEGPPVLLCVIGSGRVSDDVVLQSFVASAGPLAEARGLGLRFVAGPMADMDRLAGLARGCDRLDLVQACSVEEAARDAAVVVSRVGYNSAFTLARTDIPLVLAPATLAEQTRRASLLAELDGIWTCPQDALESRLPALLEAALARGRTPRSLPFRVDGAQRAARRFRAAAVQMGGVKG